LVLPDRSTRGGDAPRGIGIFADFPPAHQRPRPSGSGLDRAGRGRYRPAPIRVAPEPDRTRISSPAATA